MCVCKMTGPVAVRDSFRESPGIVSLIYIYHPDHELRKCYTATAPQWSDSGSFVGELVPDRLRNAHQE